MKDDGIINRLKDANIHEFFTRATVKESKKVSDIRKAIQER